MRSVNIVVVATAFAALALTACGGGGKRDAAVSPTTSASPSAVPFDRAFIDAMVPHHRAAIEMATAAKERGLLQEELNRIADDIGKSQRSEIRRMLAWREKWFGSREFGPISPEALGVDEGKMGMGMDMEHGAGQIQQADDVDATFASLMIPHHEGALAMAEAARERGQHEEIRALAGNIIDAQKREIAILKPHATAAHHSG